jgi:hypothetical protein
MVPCRQRSGFKPLFLNRPSSIFQYVTATIFLYQKISFDLPISASKIGGQLTSVRWSLFMEGKMKSLAASSLGALIWMDMSLQTPMNRIESLDICQKSIGVVDKTKLEQLLLDVILGNLKTLTAEQKKLAMVEVNLSCRPEEEVR